jgi:hypothetical protein
MAAPSGAACCEILALSSSRQVLRSFLARQ